MKTTPALEAVTAGASLRQIARKALLSRERVRRIVRDRRRDSPTAYRVTVERRGVAPLEAQLVVRAASERAAGELASWIAERKRGGMFAATRVRPVRRDEVSDYEDADP
jgi:hypothetical protein